MFLKHNLDKIHVLAKLALQCLWRLILLIAGVFYPTLRWVCHEYRVRERTSNKMLRGRHRAPGL